MRGAFGRGKKEWRTFGMLGGLDISFFVFDSGHWERRLVKTIILTAQRRFQTVQTRRFMSTNSFPLFL